MAAQITCTQVVWILILYTTNFVVRVSSSDTVYMNSTNQIVHCGNITDCIVLCDMRTTCSDSVINASFAKSLRFSCTSYATCERMTIIGPSEFADLKCGSLALSCKN
eukprot:257792_1